MTAERRLIALGAVLVLAAVLYLAWNLRAPYGYILSLRVQRLAALMMVGAASGAATMVFQTLVRNRLLTPGIVGFDALFIFLQTLLVLLLGGVGFALLPPGGLFLLEAICLMAAALALFGWLLRKGAEDLIRLVLTGVVLGVLLRGLSGFGQRLLDPSEYAVLQQVSIASFGNVDSGALAISAVALMLALAAAMAMAPALDVAAFGRSSARSLGLAYDRTVLGGLAVVSALVAVSTALVGPVIFLGLLAASLAHATIPSWRHALRIPAGAMLGAVILVLGQFVFERVLALQSALSVVIEFAGGLVFLALVLQRRAQ